MAKNTETRDMNTGLPALDDDVEATPAPQTVQVAADPSADVVRMLASALNQAAVLQNVGVDGTPGMQETRPGGYLIVDGRIVDANGVPIKDVPKDEQLAALNAWQKQRGLPQSEDL